MLIDLQLKGRPAMRVGALARRTGKTVRALHLYEERGLLAPTDRSAGGYRLYGLDAVVRVRWIAKLQEMGFSLTQIQEILRSYEQSKSAPGAMGRLEELYREKLAETEAHIAKLEALRAELRASLDYLSTCDTCDPARLVNACAVCDLHEASAEAPDLVAGVQRSPVDAPACAPEKEPR